MKTRIAMLWAVLFSVPVAFSQATITGKVVNHENEPLVAAKVKLLETYLGAYTQTDGTFEINHVKPGNYLLQVSFIGFTTERKAIEVKAGENSPIEIQLTPAEKVWEEVIVTAIRAGDKTPTTYTNLNEEEIEESNYGQDLPFLLRSTPSTVVTSDAGAGVGYTGIRIRGVDPTRTNVTINGIPINDAESHGTFWVNMPDFASSSGNIQVQRGVGTSSNGAAAFGASINIETNDLNDKPYGVIDNSIGSFNTIRNTVRAGTGLINDKFTVDMRLSNIQSNGYIDRASSDLKSLYLSAGWLGKKSSLKANVFMGREKTYQAWWGTPQAVLTGNQDSIIAFADRNWIYGEERENLLNSGRTYNYYTYENEVDNYGQDHYQLHFQHQFSPLVTFSIAGHLTRGKGYYEQYREDDDFATYGLAPLIFTNDTVNTTDLIRRRWLDNYFYGTVFALNFNDKKGLNLTLGGSANAYEGAHYGEIIWAEFASQSSIRDRYYENDAFKTDYMGYLKGTYSWNKFTVFGDLQFRHIDYNFLGFDEDDGNVIQVDQNVSYDFFNPKAGLMYDINNNHNVYASFAIANREPVRSDFIESSSDSRPDPEQLQNIEAGYRLRFQKAYLNTNLYLMNYKNQLILTGQINDVGAYTRTNVPNSYRAGIEVEGGIMLGKKVSISGNATFSQNKIQTFTEYIDDYDNGGQIAIVHSNTDLAFSPNFIAAAGVSYEPIKNWNIGLQAKYVGEQYLDNTSNVNRKIDAYNFVNFNTSYTIYDVFFKEIQIGVLVNNVFNQFYANNGYTYGWYAGGGYARENFYYPQAGINYLGRVTIKL